MSYYPLLPYVRKYLNLYNQLGHFRLFLNIMQRSTFKQKLIISGRMLNPFVSLVLKLVRDMIDIELYPFRKKEVKAVFLHNIITDFLVSLDQDSIIQDFSLYMKKCGYRPAFCTLNLPPLVRKLDDLQIESPLIMSPFNKVGYQMSSSKEVCESTLRKNPGIKLIAMSTLAAGYLKPKEAYDYLFNELDNISGVVVGVSSKEHAEETFTELQKYIK